MDFHNGQCPGCCGDVLPVPDSPVGACLQCDGLVGTIPRARANHVVRFDMPMQEESDDMRYFDLYFPDVDYRSHGWFDRITGRVVQYG